MKIFPEMELSSSKIKKILIFLEINLSYISGRNFPSSKNKNNPLLSPNSKNKKKTALKKILIFSKKSFPYISGNGTF